MPMFMALRGRKRGESEHEMARNKKEPCTLKCQCLKCSLANLYTNFDTEHYFKICFFVDVVFGDTPRGDLHLEITVGPYGKLRIKSQLVASKASCLLAVLSL